MLEQNQIASSCYIFSTAVYNYLISRPILSELITVAEKRKLERDLNLQTEQRIKKAWPVQVFVITAGLQVGIVYAHCRHWW